MELLPEDRDRLIRYIDFLESELSDFSKFSKIDWKTYNTDRDTRRNRENISQWASLRNILAHEYLDIRWRPIKKFITNAEPIYRELIGTIKPFLKPSSQE